MAQEDDTKPATDDDLAVDELDTVAGGANHAEADVIQHGGASEVCIGGGGTFLPTKPQ